MSRGGRSFLKIHFFIEFGLKMIELKIQFKTKYRIFIQKIFIQKIFIKKDIHSIEYRIFNRIIHSKEFKENYSKFQ